MKFNLKNVPTGDGMDCPEFSMAIHDWLEGFEKRQRQNLADYKQALKTKKNWDKEFLACWKAISNYIELEVLGVEGKEKAKP